MLLYDRPDKYIIDMKLLCQLKEANKIIYNTTCEVESIGETIYSIVTKIREAPILLLSIDYITPLLKLNEFNIFNRMFSNWKS